VTAAPPTPARTPLLERLALHRPELRAWALYDWANSAFFTTVVAAVFPVYYAEVAAAGRDDVLETYSGVTSAAMLLIAILGPILGAIADTGSKKKPMLAGFMALGCLATAGLWFVEGGDWQLACALFALGNLGVAGSFVFYDALLPAVARPEELDRVSSAGYALGYLGGGTLLALNLAWILHPGWFGLDEGSTVPVRLAFVSVAVWWMLFSIPLFRRVPEPARAFESDELAGQSVVRTAFTRVGETLREVRSYRQVFLMLLAMLVYSDGINTVIRMAVVYGGRIGIEGEEMIPAVLAVQFLGVPCAFGFGWLAGRIGPKRAILLGLAVYVGIVVYASFLDSVFDFYVVAAGVGLVQGGCQALSRSLFASMVPAHKMGEFFGLFGVLERFANVLGPLAFSLAIAWTGNERAGLLPLVLFFALGAWLLGKVDVEAGRRLARERSVPPGTRG
jgi:UMF1 family MFS transporter